MSGAIDPAAPVEAPQGIGGGDPRYYGFSVLVSGLAKMWRGVLPAVIFIVINAAVQAVLVANDPVAGDGWMLWLPAAVSAVVLLVTGAGLAATGFASVRAWVLPGRAFGRTRRHLVRYLLWVGGQAVLVAIGFAFFVLPGWLLWAATVYLPLAAVDDDAGNPLRANFAAILAHPVRWLVTWLAVSVLGLVGWLLAGINTFFVGGWPAALIANIVGGVAAWWLLTAWACLYRSRR